MLSIRLQSVTLHQLHIFGCVAKEGSLTKGAAALHLSEPAVSLQVAHLEEALDTRLFDRAPGKSIQLTEAGLRLLATSEGIFERLEMAFEDLNSLKRENERQVAFGARRNFCSYVLPPLYASFRECSPHITLRLEIGLEEQLVDSLLAHRLDLAVVAYPYDDHRVHSERLTSVDFVMIGPPGHRLAGERAVPFAALAAERLIFTKPNSRARKPVQQKAAELGMFLEVGWEAGNLEAQLCAVTNGLGVGVAPFYAVAQLIRAGILSLLPVEGFPIRQDWFLISPVDGTSAATAAFTGHLLNNQAHLASICQYSEPLALRTGT